MKKILIGNGFPMNLIRKEVNICEFRKCFILSADYVGNFRPAVGEEVSLEKIKGWQVLKIEWIG